MKYALKSVLVLANVGVPHGNEDGPGTTAQGSGSKIHAYHVDQHENLRRLGHLKAKLAVVEGDSSAFLLGFHYYF